MADPIPDSQRASHRIASLDGLRAISILIVITSHLGRRGEAHFFQLLDGLTLEGHVGVDVFFVISGYLITRLLLIESAETGRVSLARFYVRRTLRILPPFWILLAVIGGMALAGLIALPWHELEDAALFVFDFRNPVQTGFWLSHCWSLSVEEQFYLLWPWVVALGGATLGRRAAIGLIVLSPPVRMALALASPALIPRIDWMLPTRADMLMFGCLAALLEGAPAFEGLLQRAFRWRLQWAAPIAVLGVGAGTMVWRSRFLLPAGYTIEGVSIALFLCYAVRAPEGRLGRALNWRPAVWLGQRSYAVYLWQQPFLIPNNHSVTGSFPLNVLCILAVAEASWLLVERPLARLRRALEPRRSPARAPLPDGTSPARASDLDVRRS